MSPVCKNLLNYLGHKIYNPCLGLEHSPKKNQKTSANLSIDQNEWGIQKGNPPWTSRKAQASSSLKTSSTWEKPQSSNHMDVSKNGGVVPNNHGVFLLKNDHFGVFWGYHDFGNTHIRIHGCQVY